MSLICPILIGRAAQVGVLQRLIDEVRAGQGRTGLIAGEAGVGKSRLIAEATSIASRGGLLVLQGNSFPYDRALPYAPVLDLLRSWLAGRSPNETAELLGPSVAEIVKLLPELVALLPDLVPSPPLDPEQEKRRLFHALARLFTRLAEMQPVLAVFEDLHWSDDTSLEFLLYLAHHLRSQRLLILLTYRSDEASFALDHVLAELDRQRLAVELPLDRLTRAEVDVMLRATFNLQGPVRSEFLEAIYQLTEGNPFFIEEVLGSLVTAGNLSFGRGAWHQVSLDALRIPRTVQDAVRRRSAQLNPAARRTLAMAAVIGRRFDLDLLQEVTRLDGAALLDAIKEAMAAQLVAEESAERFVFRHALTRQTVYAELLARERRSLHQQIAEALERRRASGDEVPLADLAYHFDQAQLWAKALDYSRQAGQQALSLHAPAAAVEHLSRALDAAGHLDTGVSPDLYRARATAYRTLGDFERARSDDEAALGLARTARNCPAEWQALLDLGALWAGRDYGRTRAYYEQALELARSMGDRRALAHSLNHLGNAHVNVDEPIEALERHREALAIFEDLDDRRGLAATLDFLGMTSNLVGNLVECAASYERAIALFQELDDRAGMASSLATLPLAAGATLGDTKVTALSFSEASRSGELALKLAREIGWRPAEAYGRITLSMLLGPHGEYTRALELAHEALAIAQEVEHRQWEAAAHVALGQLYLDLLAGPPARQHLERALALAREIGSAVWIKHASADLALVQVLGGDFGLTESFLDQALTPQVPVQTQGRRRCWRARAELSLVRGEASRCLEIVDWLIATAPNVRREGAIPLLWMLRGEALAALGRRGEAEAALLAARDVALEQGLGPLLRRVHLSLGKLLDAQGRRDEAYHEFFAARRIVDELAASVPDELVRTQFRNAATALLPRSAIVSPRRSTREVFGGLTEREREVAALIAQGKSNRAIAEGLVVGERTVEFHVSSILGKLGFSSRSQIAAWAVEKGLTGRAG
jgi:DNA-binding CsgD family transcriptional regulator